MYAAQLYRDRALSEKVFKVSIEVKDRGAPQEEDKNKKKKNVKCRVM